MKFRSTGRLGRLFNAAALSGNDARRGQLRGFTLIELLVVVLIIGILSAIALPQYQYAVVRARLSEAFILGRHLKDAEEVYRLANGTYTSSFEDLGVQIPSGYWTGVGNQNLPIWQNKYFYISLLEDLDHVLVIYKGGEAPLALSFRLDSLGGKNYCESYADNNYVADRLCKSLGGTSWRVGCGGNCRVWEIP